MKTRDAWVVIRDRIRMLREAFRFTAHLSRFTSLFLALSLWPLLPAVANAQAKIDLTPDKGPTSGGTAVLIEVDEGLMLGSVRVEFGGRRVSVVRSLSLSIVEVIAPPGDPGPVPVRVSYGLWGNSTATAVFTYVPPPPRLARLEASTVPAGSEELALSVEGEDFATTCSVRVGETSVPTTFVDPQHLQARVPASLLAKAGNVVVRVTDTAIGGGTSNALFLTVVNPAPQLTAVEAPSLQVGGPSVSVTVRGRAFRPESIVQLAGTAVATQYRSDQELAAIIPVDSMAKPGELPIFVVTPGPGGGTSHAMNLSVVARPPPVPPFPGRFLVFTSNRRGGRNHIYLLDRQTGRLDPLEEANSGYSNDGYPSISADGRFIVFQSDRNGGQDDVFLFDREARRLDPLPELNHPTAFDGFPHISADGRFIVFESDRLNGRPKVFLFDRETRTLSEPSQANEPTADDGLAAISN